MKRIILASLSSMLLTACAAQHADELHVIKGKHSIDVLWQTDVDNRKPADAETYARPAVSGLMAEAHIVLGGHDGRIHVLNMNGHETFRYPMADNSDSGGASLKNAVMVVGDSGGMLYAIDTVAEKKLWSVQLSAAITGTPVSIDDDVIVQTIDDHVYRISADGKKQWVFASAKPETLGLYISPSPIIIHEQMYTILGNGDVLALNVQNGDVLWRKQLLLDSRDGAVTTMRMPLASPLWLKHIKLEGNTFDDVLLVPFYQGEMFLLKRQDGTSLMTRKVSLKTSPLHHDHRLFLADSHGKLQAWDIEKGLLLWQRQLSKGELMGPVWWQDNLWVQDDRGNIFRLNADGELLASRRFYGRFDRLPVVTDRGLLYHSSLGGLYLVN